MIRLAVERLRSAEFVLPQVLPDSLTDALTQASISTVTALQGIGGRYLVCKQRAKLMPSQATYSQAFTPSILQVKFFLLALQVEVLIPEFWDPAAGAVFSGARLCILEIVVDDVAWSGLHKYDLSIVSLK